MRQICFLSMQGPVCYETDLFLDGEKFVRPIVDLGVFPFLELLGCVSFPLFLYQLLLTYLLSVCFMCLSKDTTDFSTARWRECVYILQLVFFWFFVFAFFIFFLSATTIVHKYEKRLNGFS